MTDGYASMPLDGLWLRAAYLHNGSVPTLRDLLKPPAGRRPMFRRGCDVYDPEDMGFEHGPKTDYCPRVFPFDTSLRGEGNGGHLYGTALPEIEKNALIEYMKTL